MIYRKNRNSDYYDYFVSSFSALNDFGNVVGLTPFLVVVVASSPFLDLLIHKLLQYL